MESQRQIVKEQNEQAVAQAMADATEAAIKQMHNDVEADGRTTTVRESDPFKRNGLGSSWW